MITREKVKAHLKRRKIEYIVGHMDNVNGCHYRIVGAEY